MGVLICSSVGEEDHNAHETLRVLARSLADCGVASLRFDYHGTGDSLGRWSDPDRVPAWMTSVEDAYDYLQGIGVTKFGAIGLRVGGALVAAVAQRRRVSLDKLVLWDPTGGKNVLREGQARRPSLSEPPPGVADTPGYAYSAQTVTQMRDLDIARLPPGPLARRVLVLTRDDRPTPRALRGRLQGPEVEWDTAVGQSDLLDRSMTENVVPEATVARIVNWLIDDAQRSSDPLEFEATTQIALKSPSGQAPIAERIMSLGSIGMFGILTEPQQVTRAPVIVLVNVANDRHVGPGRRWVDCARLWAEMGFRVLRMDQTGVGDSPCHPGHKFGELYTREWLDDLPAALDSVADPGTSFVLIGLCSGAYSAMETGFRRDVAAVYAINVVLHGVMASTTSDRYDTRRRAARAPIAPLARLASTHPRISALAWRAYRQIAVWNAPMSAVSALVRRGTDVILVMSPNDGRHFQESVYWTVFRTRRMRRSGAYRLLADDDVDHPLMTQEGQNFAVSAITADLARRFPVIANSPRERSATADPQVYLDSKAT